MTRPTAGFALLAFALAASPALAQSDPSPPPAETPPPAHISVVDGTAWLDRQGRSEPAPINMPLVAGDRLRTERGRVEVLFGDGSALYADHFTTIDFQSDALLRLLAGGVRLIVAGLDPNNPDESVSYRIDAPGGSAQILTVGDYRVSLIGAPVASDVELAVLRGSADLVTDAGAVRVTAGSRSVARAGAAPSYPVAFNSARFDAFDRWSEARREARTGVASSSYLPEPLYPYASTLDQYGSWRPNPDYGYVWYPSVSVGWSPYYNGYWNVVGPFGWTWIGYDPWAWPTHHYGHWGFSAGLWFWIPGVHWGPAWVSWRWGSNYWAWGPAGYHPAPHHPWHGWHAANVAHFRGRHVAVPRHGVGVERLDAATRGAFSNQPGGPPASGLAVSRSTSPISGVGRRAGVAVPRSLGGGQAAPRGGALTAPATTSRASATSTVSPRASATPVDRRAAARMPSSSGLGAPPRLGPTSDSPGLGALAPQSRARAAESPASAPRGLAVPRRAPNTAATAPANPVYGDRNATRRAPGTAAAAPESRVYGDRNATRRAPGTAATAPVYPVYGDRPATRRAPVPRDQGAAAPSPRGYSPAAPSYGQPSAPRRAPDAPAYARPGAGRATPAPPSSAPSGGGVERRPSSGGLRGPSASPRGGSPGQSSGAPRGGQGGTAVRRPPG